MTFVGKILVILIMAFSLVFLGVSTVVFTTATNWKNKSAQLQQDVTKKQTAANDAEAKAKDAQSKLEAAKADHTKALAAREAQIGDLNKKVADAEAQATQARGQLETAQKNAQVALTEANARKGETDVLNETLTKAQTQANQLTTQNIELTDRIRILEREKATAEQNARDLRDFKGKVLAFMQQKGIDPAGISDADPNSAVPTVDGKVVRVDATNRSMEISIGSNDGIGVGHQLYLFRLQPQTKFLGNVKIVSVYPNKAVAEVVGRTNNGAKILEGDIVSSTLDVR